MLNIKIILRTLGFLLIGESLILLLALAVSFIYKDGDSIAFLESALITMTVGGLFIATTYKASKKIGKREGYIIVSIVWIFFSLFGSLPYLLSNSIPSFTNAFFETMSGFTTTGSSILNNIEEMPHGILFWRSITQWVGGMGIVVLSLAVLPAFGIGGMSLFTAESPGISPDKVNPKIKDTAKILWNVYLIFTLAETILLFVGGMGVFDAVCHSFTTMATGGYSTKQASIAHWNSPYIQYVITFFMILAGTNFSLSYFAFTGSPKKMFKNEEFKYYILFIFSVTLLITIGLILSTNNGIEESFRTSLFQVVSILTTTGYATTDYLLWAPILTALILMLFFVGGSTGSTGGGIKTMRIVLLVKNSYYELRRLIHPNAVIPVRFNKRSVNPQTITNVLAFFFFYVVVFFLSSLFFMLFVDDYETSIGAVATSLGNIGPGFGTVGPSATFAHIPSAGKWFLSFLMLLGRLELFTIIVLFSPAFWKR
ncbi:MAG: TrkH family potassium uptake protein [Prolixibacteraceae bacterium]|jgi:trk system potassium uptake protein TrkH|nr:TrkH family potassium uptake protein [Prolixibacteraceae bacterium]